jgi:Skp family chaperone for outer membrane proteins
VSPRVHRPIFREEIANNERVADLRTPIPPSKGAASKIEMPNFRTLENLAAENDSPGPVPPPLPSQYPGDDGGPARRLAHVAEKFSRFYSDLEHEKNARREVETGRRNALYDQVQKLELDLETEIRRRQESDRLLQEKVSTDLKAMEQGIAAHVREMQQGLKASIDALTRSFAELHQGLREEREQRRVDVEHLAQSVVAKVDECQTSIDDERVERLEREANTLKRVGEDIFKLQEKVDVERAAREGGVNALREQLEGITRRADTHDDKFQTIALTEIASLKSALNAEKEERVAEDEQIVHAINDYTRALQDGLRIVNQS